MAITKVPFGAPNLGNTKKPNELNKTGSAVITGFPKLIGTQKHLGTQLGKNGIHEVRGSSPLVSTNI